MKSCLIVFVVILGSLSGCGDTCELPQCDIRQPACQRAVANAAACTRKVPPVDIPIAVVPSATFIAAEVERAKNSCEASKRAFLDWNAGLALLGLAPESYDLDKAAADDAAWVGAYYLPGQRTITIIDHGHPLDSRGMVSTLAHEYAHALQDAAGVFEQFGQRAAGGWDGDMGASAVVEGEAVLVEDLLAVNTFGVEPGDVRWGDVFGGWQRGARMRASLDMAPVLLAPPNFLYPFGSELVNRAYRRDGFAAVNALHAQPPQSTWDVLAAVHTDRPVMPSWREDLGGAAVPLMPADFALIHHDTYGAWVLERFLERVDGLRTRGSTATNEAYLLARSLRGDRLSIHRGPAGQIVTTWRLRFSDEQAAMDVRQLLPSVPWTHWTVDRDLVLMATKDPNVPVGPDRVAFGPATPVPPVKCEETASATPHRFRCATWSRGHR